MTVYPIIPIWIMGLISIILIIFVLIKGRKGWGLIRQIFIIVLLFLINFRIMIKSPNSQEVSNDLDVLFVIDNTLSMLAEDYNGSNKRMDGVKADCEYIMENLNGSRFSIIVFDNDARVLVPYTKDINLVTESLEILSTTSEIYARGSTLNIAKDLMIDSLKSISEVSDRRKIVFFVSDGEITNGEKLSSFSSIKKYVDDGAVLGYGTKNGGKMLIKYSLNSEDETYLQDKSDYPYEDAISVIDEKNLKSIAKDLGIDYINMSKQSNIYSKLKKVKSNEKQKITNTNRNSYKDTYYLFVIPLIVILICEFITYKRRL